jgi:hypothetical protein
MRTLSVAFMVGVLGACSQEGRIGALPDAGALEDAGRFDAAAGDASAMDAGYADAGATDAGSTDAGSTDAGGTDAGSADAGLLDPDPAPACRLATSTALANITAGEHFELFWDGDHYDSFRRASSGVAFQSWAANGVSLGAATAIDPTYFRSFLVVANGGGYGFLGAAESALEFVTFGPAGSRLTSPVSFSFGSSFGGDLAHADSEYGYVWSDFGLKFARFSATGAAVGTPTTLIATSIGDDPSIVWTGSEYGVAWTATGVDVLFMRVRADGTAATEAIDVSADQSLSVIDLVWTPSGYVLAWAGHVVIESRSHTVVRAQRVSATGALVDDAVTVADVDEGGALLEDIDLAWNGASLAIAWSSSAASTAAYEIYVARYTDTLDLIGSPVQLTTHAGPRTFMRQPSLPSIVWTGDEYVVSFQDTVSGTAQQMVKSVCY